VVKSRIKALNAGELEGKLMKHNKAERELALDFLRVTEAAAIESAKTMGQGDRKHSDHVAVEAMRQVMSIQARSTLYRKERKARPQRTQSKSTRANYRLGRPSWKVKPFGV
jgi:hypothetical protein